MNIILWFISHYENFDCCFATKSYKDNQTFYEYVYKKQIDIYENQIIYSNQKDKLTYNSFSSCKAKFIRFTANNGCFMCFTATLYILQQIWIWFQLKGEV